MLLKHGGQGRNRTADASLFRAALYQLSYLARDKTYSNRPSSSLPQFGELRARLPLDVGVQAVAMHLADRARVELRRTADGVLLRRSSSNRGFIISEFSSSGSARPVGLALVGHSGT